MFSNQKRKYLFILFICLLLSGILGVILVMQPDFDFYSYHYSNVWAFFNNRINIDFMPNQARSYINPTLDIINYLLIQKLNNHPFIYLFISNLKYGILMFIAYLISDYVFVKNEIKNSAILSVIFVLLLTPIIVFGIRMDCNDISIANLILISIYLQIRYLFNDNSLRTKMLILSALIMGFAIGLKNSAISFVLPMVLCTVIYLKKDTKYLKTIIYMFFAGVLGFLIGGGWWLYIVWEHFGNPIFPYSNHIFKSPMADLDNYTLTEYAHLRLNNFWEYIIAPLIDTCERPYVGFESQYFDPKMRLSFEFIIITLLLYKFRAFKEKLSSYIKPEIIMIFIIYTVFAYYANAFILGTLRYVMALAVLCSIIIIALSLCYSVTIKEKIIYPLLIFVLIWSGYTYYFPIVSNAGYDKIKNIISASKADIEDNSTVFCGNQTSCFTVPHQNSKVKYVAFAIPKQIKDKHTLFVEIVSVYKNYYYTSDYLEKKVKEVFDKEKSIYIIFNPYSFIGDADVYNESVKYYSDGKITKIKDCKRIDYNVLYKENYSIICKLK